MGTDPIAAELQHGLRHAEHLRHALDHRRRQLVRLRPARRRHRRSPSYINTFQRGPQESVWETVPAAVAGTTSSAAARQRLPATCSSRTGIPPSSGSTPTRPDADARADPGRVLGQDLGRRARRQRRRSTRLSAKAREDGRLPALRDVRQVLQEDGLHQPAAARAGHRQRRGALPAVLVLRLGRRHRRRGAAGPGASAPATTTSATRTRWRRTRCRRCPALRPRVAERARATGRTSLDAPARVLPLAAVGRGRHRRRRDQQLGRPLRARRPPGTPTFYGMSYDEAPGLPRPAAATSGSASRPGRWSASPSTTT